MSTDDSATILDPATGLLFARHALDRLGYRGLVPEQVLFVIQTGESWLQTRNANTFFQARLSGIGWLAVVRDPRGKIITIFVLQRPRQRPS